MNRLILYGVSVTVVAGVLSGFLQTPPDECLSQEFPISCFMQKTYRIGINEGVPKALEYAKSVIEPYSRNALHMSMHMIGHAAYDTLQSRSEAMKLLPPEASKAGEQLTYDGYQHGVLQAYFLDVGGDISIEQLMEKSCGAWYETEKKEVRGEWGRAGLGCFHGIGHALMTLYDNDVNKSVLTCTMLPSTWTQEQCAYGVFMEVSYQYYPSYGHSLVREGDDMSTLCSTAPALAHICAKFIGHSFLMKQPENYVGAFKACNYLSSEDAQSCKVYMAEIIFPGLSQDPKILSAWCSSSGIFADECFYWAAAGLSEGFGGTKGMRLDICTWLDDTKRRDCQIFVSTYKESLSMNGSR